MAGGAKGLVGSWDWDGSVVYNRDYFDIYTRNTANYSLTYPSAKTDFFAGRLDYSQWVGNLDLHRGFDVVRVRRRRCKLSFGAEYQREDYRANRRRSGWLHRLRRGSLSQQPARGCSRRLAQSQGALCRRLDATSRSLGSSTSPAATKITPTSAMCPPGRLSTRFDFNDVFGVRATVSNGFHAPGLGTQNLQITKVTPTSEALTAAVNSPAARALGATALKPEKATNYSVGFTFSPTRTFNAAIDFYQIEITDQLGRSSSIGYDYSDPANIRDPNGTPLTAAQRQTIDNLLATAGISIAQGQNYSVNYYTNIGDTRTRGVELTLESTHNIGAGKLRWTYAFSKAETDVLSLAPIPQVLQTLSQHHAADRSCSLGLALSLAEVQPDRRLVLDHRPIGTRRSTW